MSGRIRLQHASAIPITNGLGLSGQHDNRDWPRYVRTTDIAGPYSLRDDVFASQPPDVAAAAMLAPNDIVACAVGATVGKSTLITSTEPACFAGFLVRIRPSINVDARFLSYWMQSQDYWAQIEQGVVKSTIENFSASRFRAMSFPNPPVKEQRRIADFLDDRVSRIDRIIAARREQVDLADSRLQSQLSQLMDRQADLSGLAPLRRFCGGIEQGSSPVGEDRPAEADESGVLKTSAIYRGAFFPERYKAIGPEDADSRHLVSTGDVIVIRGSGSAELVGDAAVARTSSDGPPLHLSDLTYRLQQLELLPQYAVLALISSRGRAELGSLVRQGSGPAKARGDDIMSISVPIATLDEQSSCVELEAEIREQWMGLTSDLNRSIGLLTEYKSSLITAAVTGELDVSTAGSSIPG